jgi:nucleotide-binding universal stress UspA family protein
MQTNVLVGYDGSPAAGAAITAAAVLFPDAHAWIAYIWEPPFAGKRLRRRLRTLAATADELAELIEQEGEREAGAIVAAGVALATAAQWDAEPIVKRAVGSDGLRLAQLAEKLDSDVLVLGDRGLDGTQEAVGGVCDMAVHFATVPVLMVPSPLLSGEFDALERGPVVVGYDGSAAADAAVSKVEHLFPDRKVVLAAVRGDGDDEVIGPGGAEILSVFESNRFGRPRDRSVADALIQCSDDADAAVLAVGSRGRSPVREVLLGSVAAAVLRRAHRPVMVVHS